MRQWHDIPIGEKVLVIREGYLAGKTNSVIARELGTTRSAVIAHANQRGLTKKTLYTWSPEMAAEHYKDYKSAQREARRTRPSYYPAQRKKRELTAKVRADIVRARRLRLMNRGKTEATRQAVAAINSISASDADIADAIGICITSIGCWRRGLRPISRFLFDCVMQYARNNTTEVQNRD